MEYQEFVDRIVERLQEACGNGAVIKIEKCLKNSGQAYDGLQIIRTAGEKAVPLIPVKAVFRQYEKSGMDIEACVREVCRLYKEYKGEEGVTELAEKILNWEAVKDNVYPILLSTDENRELLQNLVSTPMLDLSVAYIIRQNLKEGGINIAKITKSLLPIYGIDGDELHEQAIRNLKRNGSKIMDTALLLDNMLEGTDEAPACRRVEPNRMYVLTNQKGIYGAACILDREVLRDFAGGRNLFILPSSVHEVMLLQADGRTDSRELDKMVQEVNEAAVEKEERLTDHSYYYDAGKEEIRICA